MWLCRIFGRLFTSRSSAPPISRHDHIAVWLSTARIGGAPDGTGGRRRHQRWRWTRAMLLQLGDHELSGRSFNISASGLGVLTREPLPMHEIVQISMGTDRCVTARVVHVVGPDDEGYYQAGLEFCVGLTAPAATSEPLETTAPVSITEAPPAFAAAPVMPSQPLAPEPAPAAPAPPEPDPIPAAALELAQDEAPATPAPDGPAAEVQPEPEPPAPHPPASAVAALSGPPESSEPDVAPHAAPVSANEAPACERAEAPPPPTPVAPEQPEPAAAAVPDVISAPEVEVAPPAAVVRAPSTAPHEPEPAPAPPPRVASDAQTAPEPDVPFAPAARAVEEAPAPRVVEAAPAAHAVEEAPEPDVDRPWWRSPIPPVAQVHAPAAGSVDPEFLEHMERTAAHAEIELPALPTVVAHALALLGDQNVDLGQLADVLGRDPGLAARLLRLANSAALGGARRFTRLRDAVARIGLKHVRSTVLVASVKDVALREAGPLREFGTQIWRRSVAAASTLAAGAERWPVDADQAFLVGLLHDLGALALLRVVRSYSRAYGNAAPMLIFEFLSEQWHESVGRRLAQAWGLGEPLPELIGNHHAVPASDDPLATYRHLLQFAGVTAGLLGFAPPRPCDFFREPSVQALGIQDTPAWHGWLAQLPVRIHQVVADFTDEDEAPPAVASPAAQAGAD